MNTHDLILERYGEENHAGIVALCHAFYNIGVGIGKAAPEGTEKGFMEFFAVCLLDELDEDENAMQQ